MIWGPAQVLLAAYWLFVSAGWLIGDPFPHQAMAVGGGVFAAGFLFVTGIRDFRRWWSR